MTQQSLDNYIGNVANRIQELGQSLSKGFQKDECNLEKKALDLRILSAYIDMLWCWDLPEEDENGEIENINCLSIEQMRCISSHINNITGDNYCVDFYKRYGQ